MSTFYKTTVKEVKQETASAVSVLFDIPEAFKKTFQFTAGQYITLQAFIKGALIRRAYSICSTPHSGEIRVAIKTLENGVFSTYATKELTQVMSLKLLPLKVVFCCKLNLIKTISHLQQVVESRPLCQC